MGSRWSSKSRTAQAEEMAYLQETVQASYEQMDEARGRLLELLHHLPPSPEYQSGRRSRVEIVQQLEQEGHFPQANYAFDNGVLTVELTRFIERVGKHWVSEVECSRHIQWQGQWRRVDEVAAELRQGPSGEFSARARAVSQWGDEAVWVFTKVVRLKRYGRKRLVIVHEQDDLGDAPRFLLTDALHWESGRVIETWSYRWASEIFHEFSKQVTGLEAAQVRKEEAVTTPLPFELRSAVVGPAGPCFRRGNGKICVCQRRADLRPEVSSDHAGSLARAAEVCRPDVGARPLLCSNLGDVNASLDFLSQSHS